MKRCISLILCVLVLCIGFITCYRFVQNRILFRAIDNNDYIAADSAIKHGAFINLRRRISNNSEIVLLNPTPLTWACNKGSEEIVELLLKSGADVNKTDGASRRTPLMEALRPGKANRFSIAMMLIQYGADITIHPVMNSPLFACLYIYSSDSDVTIEENFILFQYLLEHGEQLEVFNAVENVLTYTAKGRNLNVMRYLIENDYFDVDEIDPSGDTALIAAVTKNQYEMVKLLVSLGADKSIADSSGKTAYDYALEYGYAEIAEIVSY